MQTTLFDLLQQGGWAMFPLGALSLSLFALILFTWLQTSQRMFGFIPSRWTDIPFTDQIVQKTGPIQGTGTDKELPGAVQEEIFRIESNILRWIQYLNVVATVAPMVGLLGTVSGMIGAFQTIATGGMGKPELLANDIGEALITTATGLAIGIPAMVFYFFLRNRLDTRIEMLQEWLSKPPEKTASPPQNQESLSPESSFSRKALAR